MQQTNYYPLTGGENLSQPAITIKPGELLASSNYECETTGGYRRVDGYERFDGHTAPSEQTFLVLPFTSGSIAFNSGDTVTGTVSGASATVVDTSISSGTFGTSDAVGELAVIDVVGGPFVDTDNLQVSAVTNAVQNGAQAASASTDAIVDQFEIAAQEYARSLIAEVPGEGEIRGVFMFQDTVYAFRDNVGATACVLHKSSATGWQVVSTPVLSAGGKYRFVKYNFTGSAGSVKIYGCDGVNKAFEFDGTTLTQITTGMTTDTPSYISAHKRHLFLAFSGGSLQHSPIGDPTGTWTVVTGAGEIGTGDEITNLLVLPGDTLGVFNRNNTYLLYGTSSADWNLVHFSDESGAIVDSVQRLGTAMYADDRGITTLKAVQAYGDFSAATISQKINKRLINQLKTVASSVRIRRKDQYRLFFENGAGVICTYSGNTLIGFTSITYPNVVRTIFNTEDAVGNERVFFGSDDGFIYELDKGTSFDGQPLISTMRLAFNHIGTPAFNKRFFKVIFEMEGGKNIDIKFNADYSYASNNTPVPVEQNFTVLGGGGYWDVDNWDEMVWDGQPVSTAEAYLDGIGKNVSLFIYTNQTYQDSHTLQGAIIHYSGRGLAK